MEATQEVHTEATRDLHAHHRSWRWRVLRCVLALVVLALVFVAGMGCGKAIARMHGGMGDRPFGVMKERPIARFCGNEDPRGLGLAPERPDRRDELPVPALKPFFGSVVRVEGNRIVISNNAAQEQAVISQAETVILVGGREVTLSALASAGNVLVRGVGSANQDGATSAKTIWILP